ncbi:hypothetical protein C1702_01840 [Caldimonas thermodepolymerans]|uniref:Uncharacterized protein n=2 Tax=Caldimonas thermodepolymerans TaxID=215580 RepID=A0A2S5T897_9BURK|nr:hypothetical protein C1702_01840 [Caldimonas thermodepolymerans]
MCFAESFGILRPLACDFKITSLVFEPSPMEARTMSQQQQDMFGSSGEEGEVIYTMTIRLKSGKVIRRPNGRPFRIVVRRKSKQ